MVTYFYSGAIVGQMIKGGIRDILHFDGSITVSELIPIDDVIYEVRSKHSYKNTKSAHVRQLNKL